MESAAPTRFAALLTAAIHQIKRREGKPVGVIQDELGYALDKAGGSVVEFWRKGNLPARQRDLETLARLLVQRGQMDRAWLAALLVAADYGVGADAFCAELFPRASDLVPAAQAGSAPAPFQAPALTAHFVGRGTELDELRHALLDPDSLHVVALVGMGGAGKSTLAAQAAHSLRGDFPDGVLWVHAADVEPLDLLQAWAQLYGYDFRGLADVENRAAAVRGIWHGRRVLIVLDDVRNPERLRPLLPGSSAATLITTRDLDLAGLANARNVAVGELAEAHSLALLSAIVGAGRVVREEAAAQAIARTVGQLPLALEIAARLLARSSWQSLADMAARLDDAARRLDRLAIKDVSVRTVFAVSWQALSPELRQLFAALGLFQAHSCSYTAAAATAGITSDETAEALPALAALSLVIIDGPERVRQHPLLADFAREQIGEPALTQARWAGYYLAFAETHRAAPELITPEMELLMAVLETLHAQGEWAQVSRLVAALHMTWLTHAHYTLARHGYGLGAAAARNLGDEHALAQMLVCWGTVCYELSDYRAAEEKLVESLTRAARIGDGLLAADAQLQLAHLARERGDLEEADNLLLDCYAARQDAGDAVGAAGVVRERAFLAYRQGDYGTADRLCRQALAVQEQQGDTPGLLGVLRLLADTAMARQDLEQAADFAQRAMRLATTAGLLAETAEAHFTLATVHRLRNELPLAYAAITQADELFRRIGNRSFLAYTWYEHSAILARDGREAAALSLAQQACDLQQELGDLYGQVTTLLHLGKLHQGLGAPTAALACWQQGLAVALEIRYPYIQLFHDRIAQL